MSGGIRAVWRGMDPTVAAAIKARLEEVGIEAEILPRFGWRGAFVGHYFEVVVREEDHERAAKLAAEVVGETSGV